MKKFTFLLAGLLILFAGLSRAYGDTTIVNEDFQSYADTSALQAQWVPTGTGGEYRLATNNENPAAFAVGEQGIEHLGGPVAVWNSSFGGTLANGGIAPDATHDVVLKFDIYDDQANANKRVTVGLRQASGIADLFEMGMWNAAPGPFYSFRMVSFPGATLEANQVSGWMSFHDLVDDSGTPITPPVTGSNASVLGWHQMIADFAIDHVTLELDLNRDGNINATTVIPYTSGALAGNDGFQQLRLGGPSGVVSAGGSATFDNISLSLVDVMAAGQLGDFNNDTKVDAADYVVWRKNDAANNTLPNDNGATDQATRYTLWRSNFGSSNPGSGSSLSNLAAVPEPATVVLLVLGLAAVPVRGRRK